MDTLDLRMKDEQGRLIRVVGRELRDGDSPVEGTYRIVVRSPEMLILQRVSDEDSVCQAMGHVLMAGEIVGHTTVLDLVNVISASRWAGNLHIYGRDSHRVLSFDKGALQHASSDHPDDRLNKVLVRMGILTASQVESVMRDLQPPMRLGRLLVERGYISRQQLFDLLNKQTEEIFFSAILETTGSYLFIVGDGSQMQPSTIAHIPVQELLLRGAERLDSLKQFESLVPDIELCPELQAGVEATQLDPKTRLVLALSNGQRSLREIASETWLGKFETMKITKELVRKGYVRLKPRTPSAQEEARRLVGTFDELLRYIFSVVEQHGSVVQTREEINRWLERSERFDLFPYGINEDGSIDLDPKDLMSHVGNDQQLVKTLRDTLYELTSFALFAASLSLPAEEERKLSQDVYRRLHALDF
jgi:hypothetical protein